jgi:hypothetical protein
MDSPMATDSLTVDEPSITTPSTGDLSTRLDANPVTDIDVVDGHFLYVAVVFSRAGGRLCRRLTDVVRSTARGATLRVCPVRDGEAASPPARTARGAPKIHNLFAYLCNYGTGKPTTI